VRHHSEHHKPDAETARFLALLSRHHRVWRGGLVLQRLLHTLGLALTGLVLIALFDRFLPMASPVQRGINIGSIIALVLVFAFGLRRIARLGLDATARRLDRLLQDRRQSVLSAYELQQSTQARQELGAYLVARSVSAAMQRLSPLPVARSLPMHDLKRQTRIFGLQWVVALALVVLNPQAARTILTRIALPGSDTPPYSRFIFQISPEAAQAVYGGNIELAVTIEGATVRDPVWLLTRANGRIHRTASFQESEKRFAQRMEHLVAPLEFAFATGKARSRWQRVDLLIQPRIANAMLTVTPPAYTRLPPQQFEAGSRPLQGLRGTHVQLVLTSNRPLLDGQATIQPRQDGPSSQSSHDARHTGSIRRDDPDALGFEWTIEQSADIAVTLRDVQGTAAAAPFNLFQERLPDAPPAVGLNEPPPFSLATPGATLAIRGEASDDFGLQRVDLVQALVGYRDRVQPLPAPAATRQAGITHELDLAKLGVVPGNVLEFYAEALDTHPGMAGLSVSDIARVQIISEAEYANMLRTQISLREFMQRYQTVEQTLKTLREALAELADAESDDRARKLEEAVARASEAAGQLNRLADDFAVFEMEKGLAEEIRGIADTVEHARRELAATTPANPRLDAMAQHWYDRLAPAVQQATARREQAQQVAEIAALMESAVRFRQLVQRQETLVRSLARYEHEPVGADTARLRSLGARQDAIRQDLLDTLEAIERDSARLPASAAAFAESARAMAAALQEADPLTPMQAAQQAADNTDGRQTHHQARLALERMKQASGNCAGDDGFGDLCQGGGLPKLGEGDLQDTLEQMLAAMIQRLLGGQGGEGPTPGQGYGRTGAGLGGDADSGFWMSGNSPLNIPVSGPARTRFTTSTGTTGEQGSGGVAGPPQRVTGRATLDSQPQATPDGQSLPLERIPAPYRDAIRRYFTTPQ